MDAQATKPACPLISESLPVESWDRTEIFRLIHEGHRTTNSIPLESGAFYFPQGGAYQLFRSPDGHRIGIWAADPDDLQLEDRVVGDGATLKTKDAEGQEIPVPTGTVLPGRIKDLGNGNIGRLRVFTVKPHAKVEKWFRSEMQHHQEAYLAFCEEYGTLLRESPTRWTSDGIVYELVKTGAAEEDKHDLVMTAAPGHGWHLGAEYGRLFKGLSGVFMRNASLRAKGVTKEKAEEIVVRDFERRAPLFIDGLDPYGIVLNGNPAEKSPFRYRLRKAQLRVVYAMRQLRSGQVMKTLAALAVGNAALGLLMHMAGFAVSPLVVGGKFAGQAASNTGKKILEYMRLRSSLLEETGAADLMRHYCKDWNPRQMWGGQLDPAMVPYLRAINHRELNTDLTFDGRVHKELPAGLAAYEYISGTLQGPAGSRATPFRFGAHGGVRIDEPGGLSVEYIPDRGICFARMDWNAFKSGHIPDAVSDMFRKVPYGKPYLMLTFDREEQKINGQHISHAEYIKHALAIQNAPYHAPFQLPDDPVKLVAPKMAGPRGFFQRIAEDGLGTTASEGVEEAAERIAENLPSGPRP